MKVGFIGAGKVAIAMGVFLKNKNNPIVGYFSRRLASAQKAALYTKSIAYNNMQEFAEKADLIVIATPDDIISTIADHLSNLSVSWTNKIVLHMSGVHASDILAPIENKGATVCSLHPMLSISDPHIGASDLNTAVFTIEGKGKRFHDIKNLIENCGRPWIEISTEDKILYHTAAVIVSNYLVTLLDIGIQMLHRTGFTEEKAKMLIGPLIRKTMNNVLDLGPEKALTGPISRGDIGTLEKHLQKLDEHSKSWLEIYQILGLKTVELAKRSGRLDDTLTIKVKEVLEKYGKTRNNSNLSQDEAE